MNDLQKRLLDIAIIFKRVCQKYNLSYFMCGGTLLGAVRHKGFIPWDDDMDFLMPSDDYKRLLKLYKKDKTLFGKDLELRFIGDGTRYYYPFFKLEDTSTTQCAEFQKDNYLAYEISGINIDIFPLAPLQSHTQFKKIRNKYRKAFWYIFHRNLMPFYKPKVGKKLITKFLKFHRNIIIGNILYTDNVISRLVMKKCQNILGIGLPNKNSNCNNPPLLFSPFYNIVSNNECLFKKSDFDDTILLPFENTSFISPKNYNSVLQNQYGDYMTIPPKEDREIHECGFRDYNLPYKKYGFKDYIYFKKNDGYNIEKYIQELSHNKE